MNIGKKMYLALALCAPFIGCVAFAQSHRSNKQEFPDGLARVRESVVRIGLALDRTEDATSADMPANLRPLFSGGTFIDGTGVIVSEDADVVTAAHVALDLQEKYLALLAKGIPSHLEIGFSSPNIETKYEIVIGFDSFVGKIEAIDPAHDLAVLRSQVNPIKDQVGHFDGPPDHLITSVLGPTPGKLEADRTRDGERVFSLGFPLGTLFPTTTSGIIASAWTIDSLITATKAGIPAAIDVYQADIRINPGNSGGPLFRESDQAVLGIIIEEGPYAGGLAKVVPAKYIVEFLKKNNIAWVDIKSKQKPAKRLPPPPKPPGTTPREAKPHGL